jgi:hypothetical protein
MFGLETGAHLRPLRQRLPRVSRSKTAASGSARAPTISHGGPGSSCTSSHRGNRRGSRDPAQH